MRGLAKRSGDAAREIKALIDESVQRVERGAHQAGEAGTAMQTIVDQVKNCLLYTSFALNLVAVRAPTQQTLAARGLLVTPQALAAVQMPVLSLDSLGSLCASPALMRVRVPSLESLRAEIAAAAGDDYARNLCAVAAAHLQPDLQPAARLALLRSVRDEALVQVAQGLRLGLPAWTLLVHCLYALGQQQAAIETAARTLAQWPSDDGLTVPCMPPLRANLQRARTTPVGSWLGQVLGEFVGCLLYTSRCV